MFCTVKALIGLQSEKKRRQNCPKKQYFSPSKSQFKHKGTDNCIEINKQFGKLLLKVIPQEAEHSKSNLLLEEF